MSILSSSISKLREYYYSDFRISIALLIGIPSVFLLIFDSIYQTELTLMFFVFSFVVAYPGMIVIFLVIYYVLDIFRDMPKPIQNWSHLKTMTLPSLCFGFAVTLIFLINPISEGFAVLTFFIFLFLSIYSIKYQYNHFYDSLSSTSKDTSHHPPQQLTRRTETTPNPAAENTESSFSVNTSYNSETGKFDDLGLPINLKDDEFIIHHERTNYLETRTQYQRGMRKTKYTPSISGQNIKVWKVLDQGYIILTNQRLVYVGSTKNRDYQHSQIRNIRVYNKTIGLIFKKDIPQGIIIQTSKYARNHRYDVSSPKGWVYLFSRIHEIEDQIFEEKSKAITNNQAKTLSSTSNDSNPAGTKCRACGQVSEGIYCINCGHRKEKMMTQCPICSTLVNTAYCPDCGHHMDDKIKIPDWENMSGLEFEEFISNLLKKMGYSNVVNRPHSNDGGIDIEIEEEGALTKSKIGVECKNWSANTVGREVIQKLDSAITYNHFNKGIVITTGTFSSGAIEYAQNVNITLIDGDKLNDLVIEYLE